MATSAAGCCTVFISPFNALRQYRLSLIHILCLTPLSVLGMMIAEEKEKNTMRTLMLCNVTGGEFLACLLYTSLIADSALRRLGRESGKGNPCLSESEEDGGGYRFVPRDVEQRIQYLRTARGGVEG